MFFTALVSTSTAVLIASICFAAIPALNVFLNKKPKALNKITKGLTIGYIALLAIGTLFEVSIGQNVLVDFVNNGQWFGKEFSFDLINLSTRDVIINLAMGIPLGYAMSYLASNDKKQFSLVKGLIAGFIMGFSIEMLQFILPIDRFPSLSDIIFNSLSGLMGSGIHATVAKYVEHKEIVKLKTAVPEKEVEEEIETEIETENEAENNKTSEQLSPNSQNSFARKIVKETDVEKEM